MEKELISLDIETSSSNSFGKILSIGLVKISTREFLYQEFRFPEGLFISSNAMRVNKIDPLTLDSNCNPTLAESDEAVASFIPEESIAVGRGIGYFDLRFIEADLPKTFKKFSRRVFDLTSYMMGVAHALEMPFYVFREKILESAKVKAKLQCPSANLHHALFDAWHNVFTLEAIDEFLKGRLYA